MNPTAPAQLIAKPGVSETPQLQDPIVPGPNESKKRKAGDLKELKRETNNGLAGRSGGRAEKRGKGKEALAEPIGANPKAGAQLLLGTYRNVSVTSSKRQDISGQLSDDINNGNTGEKGTLQQTATGLPSTSAVNTAEYSDNSGGVPSLEFIPPRVIAQGSTARLPQTIPTPSDSITNLNQSQSPAVSAAVAAGPKLASGKRAMPMKPQNSTGKQTSISSFLVRGKNMHIVDKKSTIDSEPNTKPLIVPETRKATSSRHNRKPLLVVKKAETGDSKGNTNVIATGGVFQVRVHPPPVEVVNKTGLESFAMAGMEKPGAILPINNGPVMKTKIAFLAPRKKHILQVKPSDTQSKSITPPEERNTTDCIDTQQITGVESVVHQDTDIKWKPIRFPPRIATRKRIETIGHLLALVAHHSSTMDNPAGRFLQYTVTLSRAWYYATLLAYSNLCRVYEFGGKRTTQWVKMKRVDPKIADLRAWYWHRTQQRYMKVQEVRKKWWGERVWREYIVANALENKIGGFENAHENILWCSAAGAIDQKLLNENEFIGQWDVAARFWSRRFCAAMLSGKIEDEGGQNMLEILGGGGYSVINALPVGENGIEGSSVSAGGTVSEIWEITTNGGSSFLVVGGTGEVIGSQNESTVNGHKRLRNSKSKAYTTAQTSQVGLDKLDHIHWESLRFDWRNYMAKLLAFANQPKPTRGRNTNTVVQFDTSEVQQTTPVPLLISYLYHPSPTQFINAIHQKIVLREPRVICERFILTHTEEHGFSGGNGNPISGGRNIGLDLNAKWRVESIVCSGERMTYSYGGVDYRRLGNGVALIQTVEGGWWVLEDTGEVS